MGAQHIFYVSCAPAHLARDAAFLGDQFVVTELDAFDMFPRTPHIELMAHFVRK